MGSRTLAAGVVVIACAAALGLIACGIGRNGEGPNAQDASVTDSGNDVELDTFVADRFVQDTFAQDVASEDAGDAGEAGPPPPPTCGSCGGACCGDQCVFRYCPNCDAGAILCPYDLGVAGSNGYCIGACSMCTPNGAPAPVTCYTCGGGITLGSCAASAGDCPQSASAGACPCPSQDAGECPGASQLCIAVGGQYICLTQ